MYGTLMRGGANHAVLERLGATFIGEARTRAARALVDLGPYPALLRVGSKAPAARVHGEVWAVGASALAELDAFEGCPELYARERVEVEIASGADRETGATAFVYVLARKAPAHARPIASGRYDAAGVRLTDGVRPEDLERGADGLDNGAPTEEGSRPRSPRGQRGPR